MKRLLLFISALFICTLAVADDITINWGVDNQLYTTTTCTVGGDVVLPPVSKRGYVFRGWTPEHFNRGTFADWTSVPKNTTSYLVDYYNNKTPMYNDFMVVTNASGVLPQISDFISISKPKSSHQIIINNVSVGEPNATRTYTLNGVTYTVTNSSGGGRIVLTANKGVIYNNVVIKAGSEIIHTNYDRTINSANLYYSTLDDLEGTWRFKYEGTWETDGQAGWKPDVQITSNQNE